MSDMLCAAQPSRCKVHEKECALLGFIQLGQVAQVACKICFLGGGLEYFLFFIPKIGDMIQFD